MEKIKRERPDTGYSKFSGVIISKNGKEVFTFEDKNIEDNEEGLQYLKDFFNKINKVELSGGELEELSKSLREVLKNGAFTIQISNTFLEVAEKKKVEKEQKKADKKKKKKTTNNI